MKQPHKRGKRKSFQKTHTPRTNERLRVNASGDPQSIAHCYRKKMLTKKQALTQSAQLNRMQELEEMYTNGKVFQAYKCLLCRHWHIGKSAYL
jgi:hypothetical protein